MVTTSTPATRRDRLRAYQFSLQRMVSAFVSRETDPQKSPFRRGGVAAFVGAMLTIVIMAGFGIYGFFRPGGSTAWQHDGALVVEKGTGATYVVRSDVLYPVANFASARLLVPPGTPVTSVSPTSLATAPRGDVIGIAGAPHTLPAPQQLLGGGWTLCAVPQIDEDGDGSVTDVHAVMLIGAAVDGGAETGDSAVLVRAEPVAPDDDPDGELYLLWRGTRFAVSDEVASALVLADQPQVPVPTSWIEAVPRGSDIQVQVPDGVGQRSDLVEGVRVGQVLQVRTASSAQQLLLVQPDGLAIITPLEASILMGLAATEAAYPGAVPEPVAVSPADLPPDLVEPARPGDGLAPPPELPELMSQRAGESLCATWQDGDRVPSLTARVETAPTGRPVPVGDDVDVAPVDEVVVPPGRAALVQAPTSGQEQTGALSLVGDDGRRYGIPSAEAVAALGYTSARAVVVPAALVARLPAGPALDPARAAEPTGW